jgi:ribosomal-protein-alanine N-acetyltransferase
MMIEIPERLQCALVDLIPISEDRLEEAYDYSNDINLYEHFEYPPMSRDEVVAYFSKIMHRQDCNTFHFWFIEDRAQRRVIGSFSLNNIDKNRMSCEIGYALGSRWWGKGYFSDVLGRVTVHLTTVAKFRRLFAITSKFNARSISALVRAGYSKEGTLRDYYRSQLDGKWFDAVLFSFINETKYDTSQSP